MRSKNDVIPVLETAPQPTEPVESRGYAPVAREAAKVARGGAEPPDGREPDRRTGTGDRSVGQVLAHGLYGAGQWARRAWVEARTLWKRARASATKGASK